MVKLGQNIYSPPGFISSWISFEGIPAAVFRIGICISSRASIFTVFVEIQTIVTRVIENTVKNDSDPALISLGYQLIKGFLSAKHSVDLVVISRIVFVVGICLEDGAEIYYPNSE